MTGALDQIVGHCRRPGAGGRTPSDFPLVTLDQAAVDRLAGDGSTVEDIWPLTPLQAGMLFHAVFSAGPTLQTLQTLQALQPPTSTRPGCSWTA